MFSKAPDALYQRILFANKHYFVLHQFRYGMKKRYLVLNLDESQIGQPNLSVLTPDGWGTYTNDLKQADWERVVLRGMEEICDMTEPQRRALRQMVEQRLSGADYLLVSNALSTIWEGAWRGQAT